MCYIYRARSTLTIYSPTISIPLYTVYITINENCLAREANGL